MENISKMINNFLRTGWEEEIRNKVKPLSGLIKELKENPKNVTIHCIRHYDLDGIGVEVVMRKLSKATGCEVIFYEEPTKADDSFVEVLEKMTPYDYIVIGDLSFSSADFIDQIIDNHVDLQERIILLDHHSSALWMNDYDFAFIKPHNSKEYMISSGTILVFKAFSELIYEGLSREEYSILEKICNYIAAYDTYFFKEQPSFSEKQYGTIPNDLNIIFKYYNSLGQKQEFIETLLDMKYQQTKQTIEVNGKPLIATGVFLDISEKDKAIIEVQKNNILAAVERAKNEMTTRRLESNGLNVAIYHYSGDYVSEIGNALCESEGIDFALIINGNTNKVGLRCKRDGIDLTKLIENIPKAGGHPKACGFNFDDTLILELDGEILKLMS